MTTRTLLPALTLIVALGGNAEATPIGPPSPCAVGTLASYIALGGAGCTIGDEIAFMDFAFLVLASGGGAVALTPADILVTPVESGSNSGVIISSAGFSVTGAQSITYLLAYNIDPHPIIRVFEDELFTETPVFPGLASVTTGLCVGAPFGGTLLLPTCAGTPASVTVFHNGTTSDLTDFVSFSPVADLGVRNTITLAANGASANFTSLANTAQVIPEPATLLLLGSAFVALGSPRRRRALR
jgi:hypothetical protein